MPNSVAHTPNVRHALVVGAALAFALSGTALSPTRALAVSQETQDELAATADKVQQTTKAYNDAVAAADDLQKKIDENNASIEKLEAQLPAQQEKASAAMRDIYKAKQGANPLMSFMLNSESLSDFLTKMVYMNQVQDANTKALEELEATQQELEQDKTELTQAKAQLDAKKTEAAKALSTAQSEASAAQAKAEAEAAAELAAAQAEAAKGTPDTAPAEGEGESGENTKTNGTVPNQKVDVPLSTGEVNWNLSRDEFVAEWTQRIDNYLAGSPLAGKGAVFAAAAWDNQVDPRWSPAISTIESGKGAHQANSYNAWGMRAKSGGWLGFGSWDEAINYHVAYLKRVYGTTCTPAAAKKYCPPTWQDWYNKVTAQMNRI